LLTPHYAAIAERGARFGIRVLSVAQIRLESELNGIGIRVVVLSFPPDLPIRRAGK
jgi:hypothetical protein